MSSEEFVDIINDMGIDFVQVDKIDKIDKKRRSSKNNSFTKNNISIPRSNLHNDVGIILEDKIANNQIQLTQFELKTIKKFIEENKLQNKNYHQSRDKPTNNHQDKGPRKCYIGVNCITWMCAYEHPATRRSECSCKETLCNKLHIKQALCKDPFHPDDCAMAHKMSDFGDI